MPCRWFPPNTVMSGFLQAHADGVACNTGKLVRLTLRNQAISYQADSDFNLFLLQALLRADQINEMVTEILSVQSGCATCVGHIPFDIAERTANQRQ